MANFTPEQIAAAKTAKSPEELIAMAKEQGIELTPNQAMEAMKSLNPPASELGDEELDNVAGGEVYGCGSPPDSSLYPCPYCGARGIIGNRCLVCKQTW